MPQDIAEVRQTRMAQVFRFVSPAILGAIDRSVIRFGPKLLPRYFSKAYLGLALIVGDEPFDREADFARQ
jgi:hypothetical protein